MPARRKTSPSPIASREELLADSRRARRPRTQPTAPSADEARDAAPPTRRAPPPTSPSAMSGQVIACGRSQVSRSMSASATGAPHEARTRRAPPARARGAATRATPPRRRAAPPAGSGPRWARRSSGSGRAAGARRAPACCRTRRSARRSAGSGSAGRTIDSPAGTRAMTTLRKLPIGAPTRTDPGGDDAAERSRSSRHRPVDGPRLRRGAPPPARSARRRTKKSSSVSRCGVSAGPAHRRASTASPPRRPASSSNDTVNRSPSADRRRARQGPAAPAAGDRGSALHRARRAAPRAADVAQPAAEDDPTRSQSVSTSGRMWVEKKTVFPRRFSSRMRSRTSLRPTGSSPLMGSSSTTNAGSRHQRLGDAEPLLHALRVLPDLAVGRVRQADLLEQLVAAPLALRAGTPASWRRTAAPRAR